MLTDWQKVVIPTKYQLQVMSQKLSCKQSITRIGASFLKWPNWSVALPKLLCEWLSCKTFKVSVFLNFKMSSNVNQTTDPDLSTKFWIIVAEYFQNICDISGLELTLKSCTVKKSKQSKLRSLPQVNLFSHSYCFVWLFVIVLSYIFQKAFRSEVLRF